MAEREAVQSRSFSPAFQQICTFVAIKEIRDSSETLRRLVCNCFAELSGDALSTGREVSEVLDTLYGLRVPAQISQDAIDELIRRGDLQRSDDGKLHLREELAKELQARTNSAQALEEKVRNDWLWETEKKHPALPPETMWTALKAYLFRAFRRHGIQAAALLDPNIEIAPEYSESLSQMLVESVDDLVDDHLRLDARQALELLPES